MEPEHSSISSSNPNQREPLIALRSLVMSVVISVIATVLYVVGLAQAGIRGFDPESLGWMSNDIFQFCVQYGFTIPVCLGGLYLAIKVRGRWFLHTILYLVSYALIALTFFLCTRIPPSAAWDFFSPVAVSFPLVLLVTAPARIILNHIGIFERMPKEKPVFGISFMLWGSTIVAVLVFLVMWTGKVSSASFEERMAKMKIASEEREKQYRIDSAKLAQEYFVLIGGIYDKASEHIVLRPGKFRKRPIDGFFSLLIEQLGEITSIEFVDFEVTDEAIAELQESRAKHKPFKVSFVNCTVIKEPNPSSKVNTKNVKLGPLSGDLP